jgi:hypothetical protein
MKHFVASLLLIGAVPAFCQAAAVIATSDLASQPAAVGSTLKHFDFIDEGAYKGSRPKTDADYRFLESLHVKYIVDPQVIPLLTRSERDGRYHPVYFHCTLGRDPTAIIAALNEMYFLGM